MNTKQQKCSDCVIGLLHHTDYSELATLPRLIRHIQNRNEFNDMLRKDPNFNDLQHLVWKEYGLKDYADHRRRTNLTMFNNCPYCGSEIDWKAVKCTEY